MIQTWTNTKISIPLGSLIANIMWGIIFTLLIIAYILELYEMKKDKERSKPLSKILSNLCLIIFCVICILFNIKNIYLSGKDLIQGTKQIEMSAPVFLADRNGKHRSYYLIGNVNGKKEKINIKPRNTDYVEEKIKGRKTISIYYHENLNMFYKVAEDYE